MKATEMYRKHNGENSVTSLWRNSFFDKHAFNVRV